MQTSSISFIPETTRSTAAALSAGNTGRELDRPRRRPTRPVGSVDVSVCIVNWNCKALLRACLESLLDAPQGVGLEVIVVDNASTDGAADMVAQDFPEVELVRNRDNCGFSRANNQAAELARGRYLFFLNNDTVVPPGTLRQLLDYAEAHPEAGIIGPRLRDGQGRYQVSYRCQPTLATLLHRTALLRWTGLLRGAYLRYRREAFNPYTTRQVDVLMGAAMFVRRDRFFVYGRWDEDFTFGGEDLELSARFTRHAPLIYLSDVEITHFGRVSTRQHSGPAAAQIAIGMVRYLRKTGASGPALFCYKFVVTLDAPLQLLTKGLEYCWRRLCGRRPQAEKSLLTVRGLAHLFFKNLVRFWRA